MESVRKHGAGPYRVVAIHGGPGAVGEMAPVAREISREWGVIEPNQSATTLRGQISELTTQIRTDCAGPATLIGFSWGAWFSFLVAAREPRLVKKLILVTSAPFEEAYAQTIETTRLSRLTSREKSEIERLSAVLRGAGGPERNAALARIGVLSSKADAYNAGADQEQTVKVQADVFLSVWEEAAAFRRNGQLLAAGKAIRCPVVALHGDYDPHPAEGVEGPLSRVLPDFRFVLLKECGHRPWIERSARAAFFRALHEEISPVGPRGAVPARSA